MTFKDLKSVKINFNLRTEAETTKEIALNCVIRWDKQRLVLSNVERVEPRFWNKKKQTAKTFTGHPEFNTRLEKITNDVKEIYRAFLNDNNRYPSVDELRGLVKMKLAGVQPIKKETPTLFNHIPQFIAFAATKENKHTQRSIAATTIRVYKQVFKVLQEYAANRNRTVDFDSVSMAFYEDYKSYLIHNQGYAKNTVGKHIKTLKQFLNDAVSKGIDVHPDFRHQNFMGMTESIDNIYLDKSELDKIAGLDLSDRTKYVEVIKGEEDSQKTIRISYNSLDRVRDLFLIGCWTGLRFSDFTKIPKNSINLVTRRISVTTQKTNKPVTIPIVKTVSLILEKYKDLTENSLPDPLSNARMNDYLKEVAKLAGLNEIVTRTKTIAGKKIIKHYKKWELVCTHTARRSFATNMYKLEVPILSIMGITGHSSEKVFLNYIKMDTDEHANVIETYLNRQALKVAE